MIFYNSEHEDFYYEKLQLLSGKDVYRESLFYVLGLTEETRNNFHKIYDVKEKQIILEVFNDAWQTSTTLIITRLAFNLYNGYIGENDEDNKETAVNYAVDNIFLNGENVSQQRFRFLRIICPQQSHNLGV